MSPSPIKAAYSVQSVKPMNSLASSFRFVFPLVLLSKAFMRKGSLENVFLKVLESSLENTCAGVFFGRNTGL